MFDQMYVCRLDEGEDLRFDVTRLPCSQNLADALTRRGFANGPGPAASTGDPDPESQQELFSRLGRDAPCPSALAVFGPGGQQTSGWQRSGSPVFTVQEGDDSPSARPSGKGGGPGPCGPGWVGVGPRE